MRYKKEIADALDIVKLHKPRLGHFGLTMRDEGVSNKVDISVIFPSKQDHL
jgi:hypothetical protein